MSHIRSFLTSLCLIFIDFAVSLSSSSRPLFLGFDLGTSGARISVITFNSSNNSSAVDELYSKAIVWDDAHRYDDPNAWWYAVSVLLDSAAQTVPLSNTVALCCSATSASCVLADRKDAGRVTRKACMYNYNVIQSASTTSPLYGIRAMERLKRFAPPKHTTLTPTSSLAKLLTWDEELQLKPSESLCHQADYVAQQFLFNGRACGAGLSANTRTVSSDWHNCLKLGYDVRGLQWPEWLNQCLEDCGLSAAVLPERVVSPGEPMGTVSKDAARRFGLDSSTVVVGGTTDSNAAFFAAAGVTSPVGTAVTSLGSTLAIKSLSHNYVEDAAVGVYSHRFPSVFTNDGDKEVWLVGGASNVGCAILRHEHFSEEELNRLSETIDPQNDSPLLYYPLVTVGERFPVADSTKEPVLVPKPASRREYLHGILQGISDVERDGYLVLGELGASPNHPTQIWTSGGGSTNPTWMKVRQRRLRTAFGDPQIHVAKASNVEASFGAALLAAASFI